MARLGASGCGDDGRAGVALLTVVAPCTGQGEPCPYAARSKLEESSMSRNILNHAALASEQGKRDLAGEY